MRGFLLCLILLAGAWARAEDKYIGELEGLLKSLPAQDESRMPLTLRLADSLFEKVRGTDAAAPERVKRERRQAIRLYEDALTGLGGRFAAPHGKTKARVQFQMARLYADEGNTAMSESLYSRLGKDQSDSEIQRESLLREAELLESRPQAANLARAESNYRQALGLCSSHDVCAYCHYRLAWALHRQNKMAAAIAEVRESLWDSKGQIREEPLRDLINFLAGQPDDGVAALKEMEALQAKIGRPVLVQNLADAYFAAGNKRAGTLVLESLNQRSPRWLATVRLLEETYGLRDWKAFSAQLDKAEELSEAGAKAVPEAEAVDGEKLLRRLAVQLDGERASRAEHNEDFERVVLLYLKVFPDRAERVQMIDGWLAVEKDDRAKMARLATWADEERLKNRPVNEIRWREMRAHLAQKTGDFALVATEMHRVAELTTKRDQRIESTYQEAYAYFQNKDYVRALPLFKELASVGPDASAAPSRWAVQSEHLALTILAEQKRYPEVRKQAELWTNDSRFATWVKNNKDQAKEMTEIQSIETAAQFEEAVALGQSPEALKVFHAFCQAGKLLPKSCTNAQVLAVRLGDSPVLIATLRKLGKESDLAAELEATGEFRAAAEILERSLSKSAESTRDHLKVALLYELAESNADRDRVLRMLIKKLATAKALGADELALRQTFSDADLVNLSLLRLPWNKENRMALIEEIEESGQGGAETHLALLKSCVDSGPAWQATALAELKRLYYKQQALHFAGKASKSRFQARLNALKSEVDQGSCYLQGAAADLRVQIAGILARSQSELAEEIMASPIPDGVDADGRAKLQEALQSMAQPYREKAESFTKLAEEQLAKVDEQSLSAALKEKLAGKGDELFVLAAGAEQESASDEPAPANGEALKVAALRELHQNATDRNSLQQLKEHFDAAGKPRLAAYFQGRLNQLAKEVKQ